MLSRSRVQWSVTAPDYGRSCEVGGLVNLSERLPHGGTLRDLVVADWFEPAEPAGAAKAVSRRSAPLVMDAPAAAEESSNG